MSLLDQLLSGWKAEFDEEAVVKSVCDALSKTVERLVLHIEISLQPKRAAAQVGPEGGKR